MLSTIAASSSSTSDHHGQPVAQCKALALRESRSLDPFPVDMLNFNSRKLEPTQLLTWKLQPRKSSFRSLENCDKCLPSRRGSKTSLANEKLLNNNYPNGNVIIVPAQSNGDDQRANSNVTSHQQSQQQQRQLVPFQHNDQDAAETPLLLGENCLLSTGELSMPVKRWRSLDQVAAPDNGSSGGGCVAVGGGLADKKSSARNSIRSWLANLFNGNGLRSSDASLRRGVIPGYDMQSERESIV